MGNHQDSQKQKENPNHEAKPANQGMPGPRQPDQGQDGRGGKASPRDNSDR